MGFSRAYRVPNNLEGILLGCAPTRDRRYEVRMFGNTQLDSILYQKKVQSVG